MYIYEKWQVFRSSETRSESFVIQHYHVFEISCLSVICFVCKMMSDVVESRSDLVNLLTKFDYMLYARLNPCTEQVFCCMFLI